MKVVSLVILLSTAIVFGASAQSCCSKHAHNHDSKAENLPAEGKVGTAAKEFQKQLAEVYQNNLVLSEALIASDAEKSANAARDVHSALNKVDRGLLEGSDHETWIKHKDLMTNSISEIAATNDLQAQRKAFASFSDSLYNSIRQFGVDGQKVYYQYCSMALDNQGAHWLSSSDEIKNPYYGSRMLKCGVTKEVL
jgi:membrane fusion protein, copper/silver efflux system